MTAIDPIADIRAAAHARVMAQPTVHNPRSIGRVARSRFAAAFMSDTKWRKLFAVVHEAHPDLDRMQVKFIDVENARQMRFPPSLDCPLAYMDTIEFGPTELRSIEWLEFQCDVSRSLEQVGQFHLVIANGWTRVIGYANPISTNVR
jgi:hypothetical protein